MALVKLNLPMPFFIAGKYKLIYKNYCSLIINMLIFNHNKTHVRKERRKTAMKRVQAAVDMVAVFRPGEPPEPVKFRYITYDRKVYTVKVGKVVDLRREFVGQVKNYIYQCKSLIERRERRYELKFDGASANWILVRME